MTDWDELRLKVDEANQKGDAILILTDPICALDVRERIFRDIVDEYKVQGSIFIKPHPRDILDYRKLFPEYPIIESGMPMEIFNYFPGLHFRTAVTVLTEMKAIKFADNIVRKGEDFMDIYEDPAVHRQNESIGIGRPRPDDKE